MVMAIAWSPPKPGDVGSRKGESVDTLVIHTTEGSTIDGATSWWDRDDVVASAHYLLDGKRIVQRAREADAAYHAGSGPMNRRSIGIEIVGRSADPKTWREEVMLQLVDLAADICGRHGIPVARGFPGIIGHCDVPDPRNPALFGGASHHTDPGSLFPWTAFLVAVRTAVADHPKGDTP